MSKFGLLMRGPGPAPASISLTISDFNLNAEAGTVLGGISGWEAGSRYRIVDGNGALVLSANEHQLVRGLTPWVAGPLVLKIGVSKVPYAEQVFIFDCTVIDPDAEHEIITIPPGPLPWRTWAMTTDAEPLMARQGNEGDYGYNHRAIGGFFAPWHYHTISGDDGEIIVSVIAGKPPRVQETLIGDVLGIKEVYFARDGGPWVREDTKTPHPVYGHMSYNARIRAIDETTSRTSEVRALIVPWCGKPFVLQGRDCEGPATATSLAQLTDTTAGPRGYSIDPRTLPNQWTGTNLHNVATSDDMWSFTVNIDKGTMPKAVVIVDPANNTGLANDANLGNVATAPIRSWEAAFDRAWALIEPQLTEAQKTRLAGSKEIGGTTFYVIGAGNQILPSFDVARPMYGCACQNVNYLPHPSMPPHSITFTSVKANPARVERVYGRGMGHYMVTFDVGGALNNGWNTPRSVCFEDWDTDGGPEVVAEGETYNGGLIYAGITKGVPPWRLGSGNYAGLTGLINVSMYRHSHCGIAHVLALAHDVRADTIGSVLDDFHADPKVSYKVVLTNVDSREYEGGPHFDAMQFYYTRTMGIVVDFDCGSLTNDGQGIYLDGLAQANDYVFLRPRVYAGHGSPALGFRAPSKNTLVVEPEHVGGGQRVWDVDNALGPAECFRLVTSDPGSLSAFESVLLPGLSVVYPYITEVEPPDGPLATPWDAGSPLSVWDTSIDRTLVTVTEGSGDPVLGSAVRASEWRDAKYVVNRWMMEDEGATSNKADRRRPLVDTTTYPGQIWLNFEAPNTNATPLVDTNLYTNPSTATSHLSGSAERELWYIFDFQEPSTGLPANRGARTIMEPLKNNLNLVYSISSGVRRLGLSGRGSDGVRYGPDLSSYAITNGRKFLRVKLYADRVGLVLYDPANPDGLVFPDVVFPGGVTKSLLAQPGTISGWASGVTGLGATFVKQRAQAMIVFPRLDGNPSVEASLIAIAKARIGL